MLPFLCQYAKRHCRCKMWRCQKSETKLVFISDQFSISCQIWMDSAKNWRTQIIIIIIIVILHFATATAKDQNIFISLGNKVSPRTMIKVTLSHSAYSESVSRQPSYVFKVIAHHRLCFGGRLMPVFTVGCYGTLDLFSKTLTLHSSRCNKVVIWSQVVGNPVA